MDRIPLFDIRYSLSPTGTFVKIQELAVFQAESIRVGRCIFS